MIEELRRDHPLTMLLKAAKMSRSTFYYHMSKKGERDKYAEVKEQLRQIYQQHHGNYGYRRMTFALRQKGIYLNHKTVLKLMQEEGLKCLNRRKKYHSYKGQLGKIADNLLKRNFQSEHPNEKWVTDITQFNVSESRVYLSPILDLFNREIISYEISISPEFRLVDSMLKKAIKKTPNTKGIILHSDQGWHYQMKRYSAELEKSGIRQSMSRKGNCLDNAVIENFFGILKSEMFYGRRFKSVNEFIQRLKSYLKYYNEERIKLSLNGLSPKQFRLQFLAAN